MSRFDLCQRWLLALSCLFAVFGVAVAVLGGGLLPPWDAALTDHLFGGDVPAGAAEQRRFLMGPLGGTMAGSYLLQAFIIHIPFRRREPWAWHASVAALLLWFVTDSLVSIGHGAVFNVWMVNIVPLVLFGLPLLLTRHDFGPERAH